MPLCRLRSRLDRDAPHVVVVAMPDLDPDLRGIGALLGVDPLNPIIAAPLAA